MNDKSPIQEQNSTPRPVPKNSVLADELSHPTHEELPPKDYPYTKEINLNELFPDVETNLNDLFPGSEMKHLLKSIMKNKKDMSAVQERLTIENKTPDEDKN